MLLEIFVPASGAIWVMPKGMVFIDSIDRAHAIATYLQNALCRRGFALPDAERVVRSFSADSEPANPGGLYGGFSDG